MSDQKAIDSPCRFGDEDVKVFVCHELREEGTLKISRTVSRPMEQRVVEGVLLTSSFRQIEHGNEVRFDRFADHLHSVAR